MRHSIDAGAYRYSHAKSQMVVHTVEPYGESASGCARRRRHLQPHPAPAMDRFVFHCREAAVAAREVSAGEAAGGCGDGSQCEERPPVDGGRNPEEVVEALEPSHWRETPSTPIFQAFEALEVVEMLKRGVEQCYDENPEPGGSPLLLSRCNLAALLHDCAEEVSRGRAGWLPAESFQRMGEDRRPPTPSPPEY